MAKEEKNTPVSEASTESNDTQVQALNEREKVLNEREEALNQREQALNEVEKHLNAREQQLNQLEEQLNGNPEEPTAETPHKGHEFTFRNVRYKFADDAHQVLLIGGEALSQEEIANDEDLLLQLIGGQSPLISRLVD